MSFIQGDYEYSQILETGEIVAVSLSYNQSYTYTLAHTPVTEDDDEDTYIMLSVFDHDDEYAYFPAGQSSSGYVRSVYYSYNGDKTITVRSYNEDPYETSTVRGSYSYYDGNGVRAVAVDKTKTTYGNIPSTVTDNGVTYTVKSLNGCFYNCSSMTTFPTVPDTVTNYSSCFYRCFSLRGIFHIPNNQSQINTYDMFWSTSGSIYLVTDYAVGTSDHTALKAIWKPVANAYNNVYFEADGVPIHTADVVLTRVNDTTGADDPEGMSVKIECTTQWSTNNLPENWVISHSVALVLDLETTLTNPTWSTSGNTMTGTITKYSLGDPLQHRVSMEVTQTIKDGSNATKLVRTASDLEVLSSVFAIFDFYPGGRGLAIGAIADSEGLNVSLESYFNRPMRINDESGFFVDTTAQTGDDGAINSALSTLGWSSLISRGYLGLKQSLAKFFDFIATTGSASNTDAGDITHEWSWRKWPDGTFDMWATLAGDFYQHGVIDDDQSENNIKWLTYVAYFRFPESFSPINANYMAFVTWGDNTWWGENSTIQCELSKFDTNGFTIHATKYSYPSQGSSRYTMADRRINIYIHGRWK